MSLRSGAESFPRPLLWYVVASGFDEGCILLVGHRVLAEIELRQMKAMLRLLVGPGSCVSGGITAHEELTCGDSH